MSIRLAISNKCEECPYFEAEIKVREWIDTYDKPRKDFTVECKHEDLCSSLEKRIKGLSQKGQNR